ncbi:MAG TPA: protein-glutamate O-methyltransferase CheR [Candidatus Saccharimonadales bacterium]|nr:protein-glutamate O-methyltransferase CheR [Candidatus Saccharimonadales bacterium]
MKPIAVPQGSLPLMRDLIHEKLGIHYDHTRYELLLDKLLPLARAKQSISFLDYYYQLKYMGEDPDEWLKVMDALSVQETYFWREMDQVRALIDIIVPKWFAQGMGPLRIWSAACASGEEPYTIAIALQEAGWAGHPIEIFASDASQAALSKAAQGIYRERSFRSLPAELRTKYFQPVSEGSKLDPAIMAKIKFKRANLVREEEIAPMAKSPIIFCRNVFIYFSPETIRRTVHSFARNMPGTGYLFVGASESLLKLTTDFELQELGNAFTYLKKAPVSPERAS